MSMALKISHALRTEHDPKEAPTERDDGYYLSTERTAPLNIPRIPPYVADEGGQNIYWCT
jgi:hypothetical protein